MATKRRGFASKVPMSQPLRPTRSRLEELESLSQPVEPPKPPPPIKTPTQKPSPSRPAQKQDHDPYNPDNYTVNIFELLKESIHGTDKPSRFTVVDNALDVVRERLDVYGYGVYTILYRYSYGFGRSACSMSYGELARHLKISSKKAEMVLGELEGMGLIKTLFPPFKKLRGKVYQVILPRDYVKAREGELGKEKAFQDLRRMGIL
jgi:hypothetical protein